MLLIPAIDLKDGQCVRLKQGDMDQSTTFSENPTDMALNWVNKGARRLHLVDLNGAFAGKPQNYSAIKSILKAAGDGHPRHLLHALELYYRFCALDLVFDNSRVLEEGIPAPPQFVDYMQVCLESSTASIYEQMYPDISPAAAVA